MAQGIKNRLEYLRKELKEERISYGELTELQSLKDHIEPGDTELLEAAGVPEFTEEEEIVVKRVGGSTKWDVVINGKPKGRVLNAYTKDEAIRKAENK
ncbi:MAG: hypothetical protein ACXACY_19225 [Candidatus Hodarchaeales archaeon]|jgi:hypothetical protein